jgi:hypothetical protein
MAQLKDRFISISLTTNKNRLNFDILDYGYYIMLDQKCDFGED